MKLERLTIILFAGVRNGQYNTDEKMFLGLRNAESLFFALVDELEVSSLIIDQKDNKRIDAYKAPQKQLWNEKFKYRN